MNSFCGPSRKSFVSEKWFWQKNFLFCINRSLRWARQHNINLCTKVDMWVLLLHLQSIIIKFYPNRSTVPGSIPAWIQWERVSKYIPWWWLYRSDESTLHNPLGKRYPTDKARNSSGHIPQIRACPRVEARHHSVGPDTGRNSGERQIKKKKFYSNLCLL